MTVLRGGRVVARSDHPAEEIDALVRAMIQGDVKSLDKSAASTLGVGRAERVRTGAAPSETPTPEAVQIDGLTVIDNQGVTRLDHFTLGDRARRDRRCRRRRRQRPERTRRRAVRHVGADRADGSFSATPRPPTSARSRSPPPGSASCRRTATRSAASSR